MFGVLLEEGGKAQRLHLPFPSSILSSIKRTIVAKHLMLAQILQYTQTTELTVVPLEPYSTALLVCLLACVQDAHLSVYRSRTGRCPCRTSP
jgi:hypothetical protein